MEIEATNKSASSTTPFFVPTKRRSSFSRRKISLCIFVILSGLCNPLDAQPGTDGYGSWITQGNPNRVFIEQLGLGGLHELAIEITQRNVDRLDLEREPLAKIQWQMLWMDAQASRAAASIQEVWDHPSSLDTPLREIEAAIEIYEKQPRYPWMLLHTARCRWTVVRATTAAYLAVPKRIKLLEWTLATLRATISKLEELERRIDAIPKKSSDTQGTDRIDLIQWTSLAAETDLLICDLISLQATLYPPRSDDRIAAGTRMLQKLEEADTRIGMQWPDRPTLAIARARAKLHLSLPQDAFEEMQGLIAGGTSMRRDWQLQMVALLSESLRALGRVPESEKWIERSGGWQSDPALALEHFANVLHSSNPQALDEAMQIKRQIGDRFGGYWGMRADALLVANSKVDLKSPNSPDPSLAWSLLESEIKQLIANNQWSEASEKLSLAEISAADRNDDATAFSIALKNAALLGIQKNFIAAANEFHRASLTYAAQPTAPTAAMNAVAMVQQYLNASEVAPSPDSEAFEQMEAAIDLRRQVWLDIVSKWPQSIQAEAAQSALGEWYLSKDQLLEYASSWFRRFEQWKTIERSESTNRPQRDRAWCECLAAYGLLSHFASIEWLDQSILIDGSQNQTTLAEALQSIEQSLRSSDDSELRQQVLNLMNLPSQAGWNEIAFLPQLETDNPDTSLGLWLACENKLNSAMLNPKDPRRVIELQKVAEKTLSRADELKRILGPKLRMHWNLKMELIDSAIRYWQSPNDPMKIALLAKAKGKDHANWWGYQTSRILSETDPAASLDRFRRLAAGLVAGSAGWLECRARSVQCLRSLGNKEEAQRLAELVLATFPNLPEFWKERFR